MAWTGVDFDGTLVKYTEWHGPDVVGEPVEAMVTRVKGWLAAGKDVRIFTARVAGPAAEAAHARAVIERWCIKHLGRVLPVTCRKDRDMTDLWDDRVVQLVPNEGRPVTECFCGNPLGPACARCSA